MSRSAAIESPRAAAAFAGAVLAAVLWPIRENWRAEPRDGFPLSYYPMFSIARRTTLRVTHFVGRDAAGGKHLLPGSHAGDGGLNQVRKQIRAIARAGDGEALCARVAARAARDWPADRPPLREVAVVTGRYGMAAWFAGERAPVALEHHARHVLP